MDDQVILELTKRKISYEEYHKFLQDYLDKNHLVSICGSHGKTTLTKMLYTAFKDSSSALIGDGEGYKTKNEKYFFLESCEYKNHFLTYDPSFIVISNIDYDHVDFFKTEEDYQKAFEKFSHKTKKGLINYEDKNKIRNNNFLTYGLSDRADFYVTNSQINEKGISGELFYHKQSLCSFSFSNLFGECILKDVIATLAFGFLYQENLESIKKRLSSFEMAKRRFNIIKMRNDNVIINDYAHHPSQIKENLRTIKKAFPNYRYIAFFKPDRESRLLFFENQFIEELTNYDKAYLVDYEDHRFEKKLQVMTNEKVRYFYDEDISKEYYGKERNVFVLMSSKNMINILNQLSKLINQK